MICINSDPYIIRWSVMGDKRPTRPAFSDISNIIRRGMLAAMVPGQFLRIFFLRNCDTHYIREGEPADDEERKKREERNRKQREYRTWKGAEETTEQREERNRKQREYRARKKNTGNTNDS